MRKFTSLNHPEVCEGEEEFRYSVYEVVEWPVSHLNYILVDDYLTNEEVAAFVAENGEWI